MARTVQEWLDAISSALRREEDWRKDAHRALRIYHGQRKVPFNVLYSNTETLLPALYSAQPRPNVQRRFKDDSPVGNTAAQVGQRALEFEVDTNNEEYATFDSVMEEAVVDALVPSRACTRVRYDAELATVDGVERKAEEYVCYESVKYNRYIFGFARKWKEVPWLAFMHDITQKEATELFGFEKASLLTYSSEETENNSDKDDNGGEKDEGDLTKEEVKTTRIWEIWDRIDGRVVRFISANNLKEELKVDPDPLEITGFYPVPEPLRFLRKSNNLVPTVLYSLYEEQADELNDITRRIRKIVQALKVRGVYDSTIAEFPDLLTSDGEDNKLVPSDSTANLQDRKLEDSIWLLPIDKLVTVLAQLIVARQQCKQVIYEVTGISDIIRGSTQASETARAQEIKTQWGTLRLKRMQRDVQRYARDLLRISLEIMAKKFSPKTFMSMTGLQLPTEAQKAQAQQIAQAAQQMQQPLPPEIEKAINTPSWEATLAVLSDDTQRQYKIDIETNSTVDLEATEDKKDLAEIMNAMSQFLNGVAPLVENGTMSIEAAKAMLLTITRRFRFGADVEEQIKAMKPPQKQDDGKAQLAQIQVQQAQKDFENKTQLAQMEIELKKEEYALKRQELQSKAAYNKFMADIKMREVQLKHQTTMQQTQVQAAADIAVAQAQPQKQEAPNASI